MELVRLLVGSLVAKSYHTKQKDSYSLPTNTPTNNRINSIWTSKKIGLKTIFELRSFFFWTKNRVSQGLTEFL